MHAFEINSDDLRIFAKEHKTKETKDKPYVIKIDENKYIGVNPQYLIDAVDFTGTNIINFGNISKNNLKTPMFLIGQEGIALVVPVHIQEPEKAYSYMETWRENK